MLISSAALALVLQCAQPLQPSPLHPSLDIHSSFQLDASGIHGDVSPCPVLPARSAVFAADRAKHGNRAFHQDLAQSNALPLQLAEADLDQIIPGMAQGFPASPAPSPPQWAPPPQPTYESWDVLRQYPRAAPLAQPTAPASKPSETPNTPKESNDEKAAKRTPASEQG